MKRIVSLGLMLLTLASGAQAATPDAATLAKVDKIFEDWRVSAHAPGVAYGIVADGKLVAVRGIGIQDTTSNATVTPESLFRIASMSKAFTALAILKLRDEGKLSLDAPAETYVPELKAWTYPTSDSPKITVRNLLNHTAGFVEDNPWGDRQQVLTEPEFTALLKTGVDFSRGPGLAMEYSNLGYATLGRIISNVSGTPYQAYIRREIMAPLGMGSTGFDVFASPAARRAIGYRWENEAWLREPDMKDGAFGAMGGVETSANDYAKWVAFLLSGWPARDGAETGPVRRASIREIITGSNFIAAGMRNAALGAPCRTARAYGMGWNVLDDCDLGRVVTHSGGYPGYGSNVVLLPDKGVGVFAFSSLTYGPVTVPTMRAAMALKDGGALQDRPLAISPGLAQIYEGARAVWRSGDINAAPLGNNVLMDRDAAAWRKMVTEVKTKVGECATAEPVTPISEMEGRFIWTCSGGKVEGRVQRAPTKAIAVQALDFRIGR